MGKIGVSTIAILVGLVLGIISAIHALGSVGLKTNAAMPAWSEWQLNSNDSMLVYALGHFLGEGQLPPPKAARLFVRSLDDEGNSLRADCVYVVEGKVSPARWWTMSVAEMGNAAPQSEITAGEAVVNADGTLKVTISARPMPGNWIVPQDQNHLTLHYVINELAAGADLQLPKVTKGGC